MADNQPNPCESSADAAGTNVPIDTITNGTISPGVIIPEPSSLILATIGLATWGTTWFARGSRQKAA